MYMYAFVSKDNMLDWHRVKYVILLKLSYYYYHYYYYYYYFKPAFYYISTGLLGSKLNGDVFLIFGTCKYSDTPPNFD